eukprot:jgi/Psemu1/14169/gm1.14169_g
MSARVPLIRHVQLKLQRFIDFGRLLTEQGLDWEDRNHYSKEAFKEYWSGMVKARQDSTADRVVVENCSTPSNGSANRSTKLIDQLKYESWIRKSRDKTTFPALQNDAKFEHWLVKFKAKLETTDIDIATFLDPNWPDISLKAFVFKLI